jgi:hypothetical protein
MAKTPDILIWIITTDLTDGSEVASVELEGTTIECITPEDAEDLARGIVDLINQHSNMTAGVTYG